LNVQLIRNRPEDDKSKTGIGVYADNLERILRDSGLEVEVVPFEPEFEKGLMNVINEGMIEPFRRVVYGRKRTDIVHVAFEHCSILMPFTRSKRVVTMHHIVSKDEKNSRKWFITWRLAAWISIAFSDKIIAMSSQTKKEILQRYSISPDKVEVIVSIPEDLIVMSDVPKEHMFGCMGTLSERKNFSAAINVFKAVSEDSRFSDYRLVICGKGPLKGRLSDEAEALGIGDRVSFIQDISKEDMIRFYNRCSLVLNTSLHEGLGLATIEAQMCGTPVLYFKDADIPEESTKAAVPCSSESDMAEKAKVILCDKDLMKKLTDDGLDYVAVLGKGFKERTLEVYGSLCKK
jgi:glycosyltransferase involved in cell wall biosynthesis